MTLLLPTCERVTALLTEYEEGALGPFDWLGMKLHLALCPPCQEFLDSFDRTPVLLRRVWDDRPTPVAEHALTGALAALREGRLPRGPQHHPEAEAWVALAVDGDPLLALLLRVHLGYCEACRTEHGETQAISLGKDPVAALAPHLPNGFRWSWSKLGLGGSQVARLLRAEDAGGAVSLAKLQGGRRVPRHDHLGPEVSLLLCGGLQDGPAHLTPGDWIAHDPGHLHAPLADPGGECLALVFLEGGIRFQGWRSLFGVLR